MKILIGADPELFLKNPNNDQFVSAHGMIPGTKKKPHKVNMGAVQIDGTALEFNIDPANSADEFVRNINAVRNTLSSMVPGYTIITEPVAMFEQSYFDKEVPFSAKELGCEPDFCAWTGDVNPRPDPGILPMRTASGHVHIGWTTDANVRSQEHFDKCAELARQLDYYLGVWSLLWDADNTRRSLYGKAGAFRVKPYGMEYRVLSNRWLTSELLMRWVYSSAVAGTEHWLAGEKVTDMYSDLARIVIDENQTDWPEFMDLEGYGIPAIPAGLITKATVAA